MPIPTKILDNLRNNNKSLDIDIVDTKGNFDAALLCPFCNIKMGYYTDKTTGQQMGYICPQCSHTHDPKIQSKAQGGKTLRRMSTRDGDVTSEGIDMRRNIESIFQSNIELHDNLYQARADKSSSSATKSLQKLDYAGKKRPLDQDEELLKKQGFTILDSQERLPA